jgi:uncharacterized membrane protein YhdT
MQNNQKSLITGVFKVIFTVIAIISMMFVFYNISLHTDDQDIEVFAEIK